MSGRDLIERQSPMSQAAPPIIMADPSYDLGPQESLVATQAVLRTARPAGEGRLPSAGAAPTAVALPKVSRLPGTGEEAQAIKPKLQAYAGSAPLVYTDQWALEGVFKAIKRPKLLVLSTHGFFLPEEEHNPLLRCGLLLAGCNRRDQAPAADGAVRGSLTGATRGLG